MLLDLDIQDKDLTLAEPKQPAQVQPIQYETPQVQQVQVGNSAGFEDAKKSAFNQVVGNETTPMSGEQAQGWQDLGYTSATEATAMTGNYTPDYSDISDDDANFLTALGKVESRNNYYAKPNGSGYEGKYQFRFRAGDDGTKYAKMMGITHEQWRKSPQLQEKHMQYVLKNDYDKGLKRAGIPINNYTRWLRHNQGLGGTRAMLKGKLSKTIRRNIRNQGVKGSTDAELIRNYHKKFRHRFTAPRKLLKPKKKPEELKFGMRPDELSIVSRKLGIAVNKLTAKDIDTWIDS